jgi:hypothetical protein
MATGSDVEECLAVFLAGPVAVAVVVAVVVVLVAEMDKDHRTHTWCEHNEGVMPCGADKSFACLLHFPGVWVPHRSAR